MRAGLPTSTCWHANRNVTHARIAHMCTCDVLGTRRTLTILTPTRYTRVRTRKCNLYRQMIGRLTGRERSVRLTHSQMHPICVASLGHLKTFQGSGLNRWGLQQEGSCNRFSRLFALIHLKSSQMLVTGVDPAILAGRHCMHRLVWQGGAQNSFM